MFSSKDLKVKLVYMGFGGLIAIIGMLFGIGMLSSVTAQRDKFGAIECTSLRVVDVYGESMVILTTDEHGGVVSAYGKDGEASAKVGISEHGGVAGFISKDGKTRAGFVMTADRGGIAIYKDGKEMLTLSIDEYGGNVSVHGKDGLSDVGIAIDEHGGRVSVYGKDGKSGARLSINEHGGRVSVAGKGEGTAVMGINEFGNGAVSTFDKYGYRQ